MNDAQSTSMMSCRYQRAFTVAVVPVSVEVSSPVVPLIVTVSVPPSP